MQLIDEKHKFLLFPSISIFIAYYYIFTTFAEINTGVYEELSFI